MEEFFKYVKPSDLLYTDCTIYGHQLLKIGSDSLGIENLLAAYAMDTTKMELLKEVAGIYQKQKRWKDAIRIQELRFEKAGNTLLLADYFDLGLAYFADTAFQKSKEMFDTVVTRSPNFFPGYVWLSRAVTRIDTSSQRLMLKPVYDRMVALALDSTALIDSMKFKAEYFPKYKNDLVLAINYLGYYYIQQDQPEAAAKYYYRIQQIDPNDPNAKLFFEQQKKKKK
jgi:tetratricopeptide (TPR) repeat protein